MINSAFLMAMVLATGLPIANAAVGPVHNPNLPYCLEAEGGGSQWCGFQTLHQCSESASGTGRECTENVWIGDERRTVGGPRNFEWRTRPHAEVAGC
ncbi:MAG: DUF3551 domain-containing protein [Alcaligenaceae bacterium]|jgi:hypothetical protein|nr:MAG: DUF3551 domain-containing protein [Alcaligenaceae bacterium]